jgi:hypothetical protein
MVGVFYFPAVSSGSGREYCLAKMRITFSPALWIFDIVWQNRVHYFSLFTGSERSRFREHLPNNIHLVPAP